MAKNISIRVYSLGTLLRSGQWLFGWRISIWKAYFPALLKQRINFFVVVYSVLDIFIPI